MKAKVHVTALLKQQLSAKGLSHQKLVQDFVDWKAAGEDEHYVFGRDVPNTGSDVLRHVHMVPIRFSMTPAMLIFGSLRAGG